MGISGQPHGGTSVSSCYPPRPPHPLPPPRCQLLESPLAPPPSILPCPHLSYPDPPSAPAPAFIFPDESLTGDFGPRELGGSQAARAGMGLSTAPCRDHARLVPPPGAAPSQEERASPGTIPPRCLQGFILASCPCRCLDRVPLVPGAGSCPLAWVAVPPKGWQRQDVLCSPRILTARDLGTVHHRGPPQPLLSQGGLPGLLLVCPPSSQPGR